MQVCIFSRISYLDLFDFEYFLRKIREVSWSVYLCSYTVEFEIPLCILKIFDVIFVFLKFISSECGRFNVQNVYFSLILTMKIET